MTTITVVRRSVLGLAAVAAALGCSTGGDSARKLPLAGRSAGVAAGAAEPAGAVPAELTAESRAALDSGNVLYRKKAYEAALERYRLAAQGSPAHAAPLFGIYMVARAQKNTSLADSALTAIRARSPAAPAVHDDTTAMKKATEGAGDPATP